MENLQNATFEALLNLEKISMYGLSFGISRPVELLKITVDLKQTCLLYETKFADKTSLPKEGLHSHEDRPLVACRQREPRIGNCY